MLMTRPSTITSAKSVFSRARRESFCHIAMLHLDRIGPLAQTLTAKNSGYLIERYCTFSGKAWGEGG